MQTHRNNHRALVAVGFIAIITGIASVLLPMLATTTTCYVAGALAVIAGALRLRCVFAQRPPLLRRETAFGVLALSAGIGTVLAPITATVFGAIAIGVTVSWQGTRIAINAWRERNQYMASGDGSRGIAMALIGVTAVLLAEGAPFALGQISGLVLLFIGTLLVLRGLGQASNTKYAGALSA